MTKQKARSVVVIGPTASGKTALTHKLCDVFKLLQPVNLDAFQFYRELNCGTAKPSLHEQTHYGYRMVDILEPMDRMDAKQYALNAAREIADLSKNGKTAICVGGSGLYLRALTRGLDELPGADANVRSFLRQCASQWGWPTLHRWLSRFDPARALALHPNDKTRVERALEIFILTGKPATSHYEESARRRSSAEVQAEFDFFVIRVSPDPEQLRARIWQRAKQMVGPEWLAEVKGLIEKYGENVARAQSFQAIGYPEMANFAQELSLQKCNDSDPDESQLLALREKIATLTWQYARRQCTWNNQERIDFDFSGFDSVVDLVDESERYQALVNAVSVFLK